MIKDSARFCTGMLILFGFYFASVIICKIIHLNFPPAILGLVLFAAALIAGIIKESWIKTVCELLMKNMAMFLIPFWGGLVVYEKLLKENWLSVLLVIFITTTVIIVATGLFVEYGTKFLRLHHMKESEND